MKLQRIEARLPELELAVWANKEIIQPTLILFYLQSLHIAAKFIQEQKQSDNFHKKVAGELNMPKADVKKVLETINFYSGNSDLEILKTVLVFWERDVIEREINR